MSNNEVVLDSKYKCEVCKRKFDRKYNLDRHLRVHQQKVTNVICSECFKTFANDANLKTHFNDAHNGKKMAPPETAFVPNKSKNFVEIFWLLISN